MHRQSRVRWAVAPRLALSNHHLFGRGTFTDLAIAGASGPRTLRFSAPGVGFVVSRTIDVATRTPSSITILQQPSATVINGAAFPVQPVALILDQVGAPMGGVPVGAAVSSAAVVLGGQTTVTTDLLGHATFNSLVLTGTVGGFTLMLSAGGAGATTNAIVVSPGPVSATASTATVPGRGDRNRLTIISVQSRDQSGNRLITGGHTVQVTVSGTNPVGTFTANDHGDGTYTASYTPLKKGHDTITITLNGAPISGSPFQSNVH